jgi:hypothetical protein
MEENLSVSRANQRIKISWGQQIVRGKNSQLIVVRNIKAFNTSVLARRRIGQKWNRHAQTSSNS